MKFLERIWLPLLFFANLTTQNMSFPSGIAQPLFFITMGLGLLIVFVNLSTTFSPNTIKEYPIFYSFIAIMVVYQLTFGMSHINPKTWEYFFAKIVTLLATPICVMSSFRYFTYRYYHIFAILMTILVVYGWTFHGVSAGGRFTLGFGNPNAAGSICAIIFAIFISRHKYNLVDIACMIVVLLGAVLTGSRTALALCMLALIMRYRLNFKIIIAAGVLGAIILYIIPNFTTGTTGIDRLTQTVEEGNMAKGREMERKAAWVMIDAHPIDGNGLYAENSEEANKISQLGSHNGYLDMLKAFGIPLGSLLIALILIFSLRLFIKFCKSRDDTIRVHLFIVISTIPAAMFEEYMIGVNQHTTTLFFISMAALDYIKAENITDTQLETDDER